MQVLTFDFHNTLVHCDPWFELEADVIENVSAIERHGMPDKSLTTRHHLLFLVPR